MLEVQIKAVAPHANLTPRASTLLMRFFLGSSTIEENKEIDDWMHESEANNRLFDLFVDLNIEGTGARTIRLLSKLSTKPPRKKSRFWKYVFIFLAVCAVFALDYLLPFQPLTWLIKGKEHVHPKGPVIVETGDQAKTFWLSDSTRVDLRPHSKLSYPRLFIFSRKVKLTGSAIFEVRSSLTGSFRVISGEAFTAIPWGRIAVVADSGKITVQHPDYSPSK